MKYLLSLTLITTLLFSCKKVDTTPLPSTKEVKPLIKIEGYDNLGLMATVTVKATGG